MKKIAIVTVNYNTEKDTLDLIKSIKNVKKEDFLIETIVVDNGSKDKLVLPKNLDREFLLIKSNINTGFSGGYNIGIKEADRKSVV